MHILGLQNVWRAFGDPWKESDIGPRTRKWVYGRNITLDQDKEVSSGRNLMFKLRTNKKTTGKNISLG